MAAPTTGYDTATITNPAGDLTNFSLMVDLSTMSASWWSAVDTADGTKGRAYKNDGTTELAIDWIDFNNGAETGLARILYSGTLSMSGTQIIRIYPPNTGNSSVAASATYGAQNAYNSNVWGYWPLSSDVNDRTANARHFTKNDAAQTIGGQSGKIGASTLFSSAGTPDFLYTSATYDFDLALSETGWFAVNNTTADQGYFGSKTGAYLYNIIWFDNATHDSVAMRYGNDIYYGTTDPSTNWTHVSMATNGTNDNDLYVNGARETGSTTAASGTMNFTVGFTGTNKYLNGYAQHVFSTLCSCRRNGKPKNTPKPTISPPSGARGHGRHQSPLARLCSFSPTVQVTDNLILEVGNNGFYHKKGCDRRKSLHHDTGQCSGDA